MSGEKLTPQKREQRLAILRDVERSGGNDTWSHLHSHGHHYMQVQSLALAGMLKETKRYHYSLTDLGRRALSERGGQ